MFGKLPDDADSSHRTSYELTFHCGQSDRLVVADHSCLLITSWERDDDRGDQSHERSRSEVEPGLRRMHAAQ